MKEEKGGDEGNNDENDAEEMKAARSFVSFSLVKETMEPWYSPLLSLGEENTKAPGGREPWRGRRHGGDAARSFVSFSLEKETKEPWAPPLLYL